MNCLHILIIIADLILLLLLIKLKLVNKNIDSKKIIIFLILYLNLSILQKLFFKKTISNVKIEIPKPDSLDLSSDKKIIEFKQKIKDELIEKKIFSKDTPIKK